jgi:hypothetical protein
MRCLVSDLTFLTAALTPSMWCVVVRPEFFDGCAHTFNAVCSLSDLTFDGCAHTLNAVCSLSDLTFLDGCLYTLLEWCVVVRPDSFDGCVLQTIIVQRASTLTSEPRCC